MSELDRLLGELDALQTHGAPHEEYDALLQKCYRRIVLALRKEQRWYALAEDGSTAAAVREEDVEDLRSAGIPCVMRLRWRP